ncbi:MAG: hypothetical protein IJ939_02550 [Clostridia bacterium]|nr:hypothetical protein [Clostridia bacterium]
MKNDKIRKIIEKYYLLLDFPKEYDKEFYEALDTTEIPVDTDIETYDQKCTDGKRNLLSFLYMCEKLKKKFEDKSIPEHFFYESIAEIRKWTKVWTDIKGELYLYQLDWLALHFKCTIFRLGRLQFCMRDCNFDVPEKNLHKGDKVIDIHIPSGEKLCEKQCKESIRLAKEFFTHYFPEYEYDYFICHSWLMDETLKEILPKESNIVKFQNLFEIYDMKKSDDILNYVFGWKMTRADLEGLEAKSSLAQKVKEHISDGGDFFIALGIIDKEKELI